MSLSACASSPAARGAQPAGLIPVGVAEIDITPTEAIRLTGYGNREQPTDDVRQRLWAKALAFGDDATASVLIAVDLIGVPRALTEEVARRLGNTVRREQFVICATHTHTGPSLAGVLPYIFNVPASAPQQQVIDSYTSALAGQLERVARAALADRRPARVSWSQGRAGFAANRRVIKDGKWTGFGVTPGGAVDHDLPMLAVHGTDGALRAVFVNYACHATTLEARDNFVHGDWPGVAKELIQQRHPGALALVAIGTGADANPNPRGGGLPDVQRNAAAVADEVDRLLAAPMRPLTSPAGPSRDHRPAARAAAGAAAVGRTGRRKRRRDSRRRRSSRGSIAANASPPRLPIRSRRGRSATASAWSSLAAKSWPTTGCA